MGFIRQNRAAWYLVSRHHADGPRAGAARLWVLFSTCQAIIKIVTGCIGDPLDMAVMRQGPLLYKNDRPALLQLLRSAFWIRIFHWVADFARRTPRCRRSHRTFYSTAPIFSSSRFSLALVCSETFCCARRWGIFQVGEQFKMFMVVDSVWQVGRVAAVVILFSLHKTQPRFHRSRCTSLHRTLPSQSPGFYCLLMFAHPRHRSGSICRRFCITANGW